MDHVQALRFFQAHNREQIQRLIELAPPRHEIIYQLLPLLFHINSKVLPGYISDDIPAGLIDYRPDRDLLDKARQLEKNFRYRRRALRRYPLRGLYLINTAGLLHYPAKPCLELWLLCSDKVTAPDRQLLQKKLDAICDWAQEAGLQLLPRLFSESQLNNAELSARDKENFYSAGLVLAGSLPYWWLLTPEQDRHYQQHLAQLKSQRMLNQISLVDFGENEAITANDLFSASAQAIKHSLQGDNAALLDLLYLQHCLAGKPLLISSQLKRQVYQQQTHLLMLDSAYLKVSLLEQNAETAVIDAAREAFYLCCHEQLSRQVRQASHPWRREALKTLVNSWGWTPEYVKELDNLRQNYSATARHYRHTGSLIQAFLVELKHFQQRHDINDKRTIAFLQSLYQHRFQPAIDSINSLPAAIRPDSNAERLYLYRFREQNIWQLSQVPLQKPSASALFQHEKLLPVLGWAINNQLLARSNWLSVNDQYQKVTTSAVVELSQQLLRGSLQHDDLIESPDNLLEPEQAESVLLFANIEQQPQNKLGQQGLQLSSKQSDPLNYTSFKLSLVASIEALIRTKHGSWHYIGAEGDTAPLELITGLLRWPFTQQLLQHIQCWCPTAIFGQTISNRLKQLVQDCCRHYLHYPNQGRVLLNITDRSYQLQWQQKQIEFTRRPLSQDLWQALLSNNKEFSATLLDSYLDSNHLFKTLLSHQAADRISVFLYPEHNTIICYLLDEFGNLLRQQYQQLTESTLVAHLSRFLTEIRTTNQVKHLRFYRLSHERDSWQLTLLPVPSQTKGYLPIRVAMKTTALDAECSLHCGQKSFSGQADDPALFAQVHQLVLSLRQRQQHYPVYLNSLTFESGEYLATAFYMQQKSRLELLFNPE